MFEEQNKIPHLLTQREIQVELDRIKEVFKQIPEGWKLCAARDFIVEIAIWAAGTCYEAYGLFEAAKQEYHKEIMREKEEEGMRYLEN